MTLIDRFLRARHWQLFILIFGVPFFFQIVFIGMFVVSVVSHAAGVSESGPEGGLRFFLVFPLIMVLIIAVLFGWFWSVAMGLQPKVPATVKMNTTRFKIFFFIPLTYMALLMLGMIVFASNISHLTDSDHFNPAWIGAGMAIIAPLHLFSIFCMFHTLYFVAKTIRTVELQREAHFSDFAGEFFLIWFYFIGVWVVQPRINRMVEGVKNPWHNDPGMLLHE